MKEISCEFCNEFSDQNSVRFTKIYEGLANTRIVAKTDNFVAIPTLGQLFEGSLLILPVSHIESCAGISITLLDEFCALVDDALLFVTKYGDPIFFEHGASECTGGGCGIYHAHLHIVPLPRQVEPVQLLPDYQSSVLTLKEALTALDKCCNYLLVGNTQYTLSNDITSETSRYPSQYFRRLLTEKFELNKSWDWRTYQQPEVDLLSTINSFKESNVPFKSIHS